MKTLKLMTIAVILGGTILVTPSCGKYEDGPGFSLMTKKARLAGDWDAKERIDVNGNVTVDNSDDYVTFEKDGTYKTTYGSTSFVGTWEFISKKEKIRASYSFGSSEIIAEWKILRLTNEELWVRDESDEETIKFEAR